MTIDMLSTARTEALFSSHLHTGTEADRDTADEAIRLALRRCAGVRGCVAEMAVAFAEHPETARPRMLWAKAVVAALYADHRAAPERTPRLAFRPTEQRRAA